jgi:hypothetical protein
MRSQHIWRERGEDGGKREVRATKFGGAWRFQSKTAEAVDWIYYERPSLEDLLALKEVLVRKYHRRRASSEDVASVEKLIADQTEGGTPRGTAQPAQHTGPRGRRYSDD